MIVCNGIEKTRNDVSSYISHIGNGVFYGQVIINQLINLKKLSYDLVTFPAVLVGRDLTIGDVVNKA